MQRLTTNNLDSNLALKGEVTFLGSSVEKANLNLTNVSSNITFNPYEYPITYFTSNASSNTTVTLNFTGISNLTSGNALTAVVMMNNNATYNAYISAVQIDGVATSTAGIGSTEILGNIIRWQSSVTSGSANVEVYSFSIIKQASNSHLILASKSTFS